MGLVTGAREGSTRTSHDGHRARCGRLCRSSVRRLSFLPLFGFFLYFGFWLASAGVSQLMHMLMLMLRPDHLATALILSREGSRARDTSWLGGGGGGRPRRIAHGPRSVLGSLGGCRGTVRRESRVGSRESPAHSPQPQPTAPVRPPYAGQPRSYV